MTGRTLAWVELEGNVIFSARRKPRPWAWSWSGSTAAQPVCAFAILQPLLCNLQYLALSDWPSSKSIDLTTCTNLKSLLLSRARGLRNIRGLETLTNLDSLRIHSCDELLLLSVPANFGPDTTVQSCRSLETISVLKMSHPEVDRSACAGHLYVSHCPALSKVDGIVQCTGPSYFSYIRGMKEEIREFLEPFETGLSKFKAYVVHLECAGYAVHGLAGLESLSVTDAQHVGLLVSALFKAQPTCLFRLDLHCKEDGNCGCDKNEPHFDTGISSLCSVVYCCSQVRSLASLSLLGDSLTHLTLTGCRKVEVWPDFATMTSLERLCLSDTSLKEWPTGVQQLLHLEKLDIQGCRQLPAEEMMKAITCKPFGYYASECARGSLASLLADLRGHRRDRGIVADALDSRWPELVALIHEQRRYLGQPYPFPILLSKHFLGTELCYLIRLMYDLWFGVEGEGEGEAGLTYCACADHVPTIKEKMKRLLCSETFMSLPFFVWRIGRTRQHALEEWEGYPWLGGYESYMAFALIGSASIGCFNVSLNDDLKDRMVNFFQSFAEAQPQRAVETLDGLPVPTKFSLRQYLERDHFPLITGKALERLAMRVGDAVCKMARAPSVAAELGQDFMDITMDGLKASYSEYEESSREEDCESGFMWLKRTNYGELKISRERWLNYMANNFWDWEMWERKISMACEASIHNTMDDGSMDGARVLHKIMLKIQPLSFFSLWHIFGAFREKGKPFLLSVFF